MPASVAAAISASPMALGSAYAAAALIMVQIVELPDDGVSGLRHLGEHRAGEREVGVRIEPGGDRVHLLAPGPERAAVRVRPATEGAVEGMAVAVGETREASRRCRIC